MSQPTTDPNGFRWIGPHDREPFASCYRLATESADATAVGAGLTVYACLRPLGSTRELSELATAGETVQLLGVWCEGEGRTGQTVAGVERVFWHGWTAWWRQRADGKTRPDEAPVGPGPVWIQSRDAALAEALIAALGDADRAAVWAPADRLLSSRPAAIVWDGSQLGGREADRLLRTCRVATRVGAPVIALLDFPRPETVAAAESIGASAVLAKPFDREVLLTTLAHVQPAIAPLSAISPTDPESPISTQAQPRHAA